MIERAIPWVLRAAWAVLPVTAGVALADQLDGWQRAPRTTASILLWLGWAVVAIATVAPYPAALAVVRVGAFAAAFVVGIAVAYGGAGVAALFPIVALAVSLRPEVAEWFVNGPAYANEHRFPLRIPGPLLLGPVWLAGIVVVGGPVGGALLIAGGELVTGVPVLVIGSALAYFAGRALFGLTRRWLVFVPAGVVLHDPMSLTDPVLFERKTIETLRAAPATTDSLDLTMGSLGLALELVLTEKVPMVRASGRKDALSGASARLLFTPTRPGRVLAEAETRNLPVG